MTIWARSAVSAASSKACFSLVRNGHIMAQRIDQPGILGALDRLPVGFHVLLAQIGAERVQQPFAVYLDVRRRFQQVVAEGAVPRPYPAVAVAQAEFALDGEADQPLEGYQIAPVLGLSEGDDAAGASGAVDLGLPAAGLVLAAGSCRSAAAAPPAPSRSC